MLEAAFLGFSNNSKNSDTTKRNDNNNRKFINHDYTQVEAPSFSTGLGELEYHELLDLERE